MDNDKHLTSNDDMGLSKRGPIKALQGFLRRYPHTQMLEMLLTDINGIVRGRRISRDECKTLFHEGLKSCASTVLSDSRGDIPFAVGMGTRDGAPDVMAYPVANTLAPVPWLGSNTAQVVTRLANVDGSPYFADSRHVLERAYQPLQAMGYNAVVAMEWEFYLLEDNDDAEPKPKLGKIPGTNLKQGGLQYATIEELWENDALLSAIQAHCALQDIPATTALSELSPGQFEINLQPAADPVLACDQGVLLKRLIKGAAMQQGGGACFMAKPFAEYAGSGLHVHVSLYDESGDNVFASPSSSDVPAISDVLRQAIGGLQATMAQSMAIFSPNANSYRRLQPGSFVPLSANWGYNHRAVSLRVPVCDKKNMRFEHRLAGADANPYLVLAAILAGIHHGIANQLEAGDMIREKTLFEEQAISLPVRWEQALKLFREARVLPKYLGEEFCGAFEMMRRSECDAFHAQISNRDYEWYLRCV